MTKTLPLISVCKHRTPNCSSPLFVRCSQSEVIVLKKKKREDGRTGKLLLSDRITRRAETKPTKKKIRLTLNCDSYKAA